MATIGVLERRPDLMQLALTLMTVLGSVIAAENAVLKAREAGGAAGTGAGADAIA